MSSCEGGEKRVLTQARSTDREASQMANSFDRTACAREYVHAHHAVQRRTKMEWARQQRNILSCRNEHLSASPSLDLARGSATSGFRSGCICGAPKSTFDQHYRNGGHSSAPPLYCVSRVCDEVKPLFHGVVRYP